MNFFIRILIACVLLIGALSTALADNVGKLVGKVVDETGQPVPGISIIVVGTTRGAATDPDGLYKIIAIPIGVYTVQARGVGYNPRDITNVKISADETTTLNISITSNAIEQKTVVSTADAQLINSGDVGGNKTLSQETIQSVPNVKNVDDVVKLQAGVVKQGNNLFVRGGRANEVQYLVDGVPVNNSLGNSGASTVGTNDELQKFYTGSSNGTIGGGNGGLAVSANAVASISVQTGGTDADYGNAQSGIVNIVTRSGSDKFTSSLQFRTDKVSSTNQNESYSSFNLSGPEPLTKFLLPSLGINLPGKVTFFFNVDMDRSDGANTFAHNQYYNPVERRVQMNGFLGGLLNGLGFRFHDDQSNKFTFDSKIRYDISSSDQIQYKYNASLSTSHDYNNDWLFRADSSQLAAQLNLFHTMQWTHFFSGNTFLRFSLGLTEIQGGNDVAGIKPSDYSDAYQLRDPNSDGFNDLGTTQDWSSFLIKEYSLRVDFNSQVHPLHLLKTGFEFYYQEIQSTEIADPTVPQTVNGVLTSPPFPPSFGRDRGLYPGYGVYRWATTAYPNRGAAFVQDNIEFSGLNLHVGIRYDYLDIGSQVYDDAWIQEWKLATANSLTPEWVTDANGKPITNSFTYYLLHGYFSPRLAIGYPVTDRINFFFNYGHYLQFPDRNQYYQDPYGTGAPAGNLVGNPGLKPQRTIAYEAGFQDQFTDEMAFKITSFYKDIFDDISTISRGNNDVYINFDYASVRGFEIVFLQHLANNFSTDLSYSYQIAKGRASDPLASVFNPQLTLSRETRLNYDQNHTANVLLSYNVSPQEQGKFFGLPFVNNYGISLTWSFGSGFPYTPYTVRTTARNVYLVNSETKPPTSTFNLSMHKGFLISDHLNMLVTLDVTNLLNRRNVNSVFSYTGAPYKYGDVDVNDITQIYPFRLSDHRDDPSQFDVPRQIILGLKLDWL